MRAQLAALALLAGCSPAVPEVPNLSAVEAVARDVVGENLMPWVVQLSDLHRTDAKVSCVGFDPIEGLPTCDLSRDAAVPFVHSALEGFGLAPRVETLGEGPHAAKNVVAEWPGTTKAGEVILVGAHLDAYFSGADDNSSGVAAMLETARAVTRHRFARTVRFVAFDLEDFGSIGSTRYVEAGKADDVVGAIILDCVGYASSAPGSQTSPTGMPLGDVADFLLVAANADSREMAQRLLSASSTLGLARLKSIVAGGDGTAFFTSALMRSDNGLFWVRGIPALLLSDTANFRNDHYHEPTDTPDTLDPAFLAANTRALAAAVAIEAEVQP